MKLIDDWHKAYRYLSVQLALLLTLAATAYDYLPAVQSYLDPGWVKWAGALIILARVVKQSGVVPDATKTAAALAVGVLLILPLAQPVYAQGTVIAGFSHTSPSAKDVALTAVNEAKKSLRIAAYQYTSADIIRAVIAAKQRGVDVAVILDHTQENGDSQATMVASHIPCFIDHTYKIMHHKFIVVDGINVEAGSFNYTLSADKSNAENALYVRGVQPLADAYTGEWNRVRGLPKTVACKGGGQ
jgi:phosphatidylserine/phosphatidylglycerophosphate/cardiolipin synthase-like enzyme